MAQRGGGRLEERAALEKIPSDAVGPKPGGKAREKGFSGSILDCFCVFSRQDREQSNPCRLPEALQAGLTAWGRHLDLVAGPFVGEDEDKVHEGGGSLQAGESPGGGCCWVAFASEEQRT